MTECANDDLPDLQLQSHSGASITAPPPWRASVPVRLRRQRSHVDRKYTCAYTASNGDKIGASATEVWISSTAPGYEKRFKCQRTRR
jgi:hypothetical protein